MKALQRRKFLRYFGITALAALLSDTAYAVTRRLRLSKNARTRSFKSAPLLNRYRNLLLRRGRWEKLPSTPKKTILIDNKLRVITGGPPPESIFLGLGTIRTVKRNGEIRYFCEANTIANPPTTQAAGSDCETMTTDDCKSLSCTGHHCNGNDCGSLTCDTHSCRGADCGSLTTKVVSALSQEIQGNLNHPFIMELKDQLNVDDVRRLAREVNDLVNNAAIAQ